MRIPTNDKRPRGDCPSCSQREGCRLMARAPQGIPRCASYIAGGPPKCKCGGALPLKGQTRCSTCLDKWWEAQGL